MRNSIIKVLGSGEGRRKMERKNGFLKVKKSKYCKTA